MTTELASPRKHSTTEGKQCFIHGRFSCFGLSVILAALNQAKFFLTEEEVRRAIDVIHSRLYYLKDKVVSNMRQRSESKEGTNKELDKNGNIQPVGGDINKEVKVHCQLCLQLSLKASFCFCIQKSHYSEKALRSILLSLPRTIIPFNIDEIEQQHRHIHS